MNTIKLLIQSNNLSMLLLVTAALVVLACFAGYPFKSYASQEHHHKNEMQIINQTSNHDDHEHHHHHAKNDGVIRVSRTTYSLPDVYLTGMSNKRADFLNLVNEKPVILNFIFTTCTAICPTLTATFSQVQEQLASANLSVPLISITIDPEQDTPERLTEYAKKYGAGPNWQFFTGDKTTIIALQKAFDAYRGNKMNHIPLTFINTTSNEWLRIDGFASASEIVKLYIKSTDK